MREMNSICILSPIKSLVFFKILCVYRLFSSNIFIQLKLENQGDVDFQIGRMKTFFFMLRVFLKMCQIQSAFNCLCENKKDFRRRM